MSLFTALLKSATKTNLKIYLGQKLYIIDEKEFLLSIKINFEIFKIDKIFLKREIK